MKNYKWVIILLVIVGFLGYYIRGCNRIQQRTEDAIAQIYQDSIQYLNDANGREHAKVGNLESSLENVSLLYNKLLNDKAKELGVKPKNVKSVTNFATVQRVIDTVYRFKTDTIAGKAVTRIDTVQSVRYIGDSLSVTAYDQKYGFLHLRSTPMIDVTSYNENTVVTSIKGFRVKAHHPNVNFGPSANVVVINGRVTVIGGFSAQWSLFGIRVGK